MLIAEHGCRCTTVIPVGDVRVGLLREKLPESLDGLSFATDPHAVPVGALISHLQVRLHAVGVCLQVALEFPRRVIDPVVDHADDRVGRLDQIGAAACLRLADSLVADDGSMGGSIGPDLVGASHPA